MSLIYAVIAKQTQNEIINLCSQNCAFGNYSQIINSVLNKIEIKQYLTDKYNEEYHYHILKDGILIFVCLAESRMNPKVCFGFLQQIKKRFKEKYSNQEIIQAKTYDMSTSFAQTFKNRMVPNFIQLLQTYYNSSRNQDKKQMLMKQISNLQQLMQKNIDKVLQGSAKLQIQKINRIIQKKQFQQF